MGAEATAGGWGNTWIIVVLILGWVISRIILQTRFNSRHRYWMGQRQERRAEILGAGMRTLEPRALTDFPGLPREDYGRLSAELEALGFQSLGVYEDLDFSRAFPNLRTAYNAFVSGDGSVVATVSILRERRAWRRAVLKFRGVPAQVESVQLVTTWPDGSSVITKRLSHKQQGRISEKEMPGEDGKSVTVVEVYRGGSESLTDVLAEHKKAAAKMASRPGWAQSPKTVRDLADIVGGTGVEN
jgi:hypothetical protein